MHHPPRHRPSRAPIVNPYDKFTQNEFDSWIGDMTSTLRRALGYEQEQRLPQEETRVVSTNGHIPEYRQLDLDDLDDEVPDDSFARLVARRAKGKARDPREGPGLGGDRTQPIEIVSSDEEEEEEVMDLAFSVQRGSKLYEAEDDGEEEEEEEEEGEADEQSEYSSESGSMPRSSPPMKIGPPVRSRHKPMKEYYEDEPEGKGEDEYEEESVDSVSSSRHHNGAQDVISILSDDEEDVQLRVPTKRKGNADDESGNEDVGGAIFAVEDQHKENLRDNSRHYHPSRHLRPGENSYHEEDEVEEREMLSDDAEIEEIQPSDDDASFPPHRTSTLSRRHVEIRDPWQLPRHYAEDFYAGADLRFPSGPTDPNRLGPLDDQTEDVLHYDAVRTPNDLTSRVTQYYAEDIYSESDTGMLADQHPDPPRFAENEDEDSGIDSFLTPGVLTPNQNDMRSRLDEVEAGFEAQLMTQNILPSALKRGAPTHQGADIIDLDSSEEDDMVSDTQVKEKKFYPLQYDGDDDDDLEVVPPPDAIVEATVESTLEGSGDGEVEELPELESFRPVVDSSNDVGIGDEIFSVLTDVNDIHLAGHQHNTIVKSENAISEMPLRESLPLASQHESAASKEHTKGFEPGEDFDYIYGSPVPEAVLTQEKTDGKEVEVDVGFNQAVKEQVEVSHHQGTDTMSDFPNSSSWDMRWLPTPPWRMVQPNFPPEKFFLANGERGDDEGSADITSPKFSTESVNDASNTVVGARSPDDVEVEVCSDVDVFSVHRTPGVYESIEASYTVEEPLTEGCLTEESIDHSRAISLDVETVASKRSATPDGLQEAIFTRDHSHKSEQRVPSDSEKPTALSEIHLVPLSRSPILTVPGQPRVPMPVTADANVPDPTESPPRLRECSPITFLDTPRIVFSSANSSRSQEPDPVVNSLEPGRQVLNTIADGLFTPAEFSATATPAESTKDFQESQNDGVEEDRKAINPSDAYEPSGVTSGVLDVQPQGEKPSSVDTIANPSNDISVVLEKSVDSGRAPLPPVISPSVLMHPPTPASMDPILIADPYPYSLSTPGAILQMDDGSSEDDANNSLSSHSTMEKENEKDRDIKTGSDLLELQYPSQAVIADSNNALSSALEDPSLAIAEEAEKTREDIATAQDDVMEFHIPANETPFPAVEGGEEPSVTPKELHLPISAASGTFELAKIPATIEVVASEDAVPQASDVALQDSRPTKRKREDSPDLNSSDGFSRKGKRRVKGKGKGKEVEAPIREQPEHDTIHVRLRQSAPVKPRAKVHGVSKDAGDSTQEQQMSISNGTSRQTDAESIPNRAHSHSQPQLQFQPPSLFHAHGRRRRNANNRPIPIMQQMQTELQSTHTASTHLLVEEAQPLLQTVSSQDSHPVEVALPIVDVSIPPPLSLEEHPQSSPASTIISSSQLVSDSASATGPANDIPAQAQAAPLPSPPPVIATEDTRTPSENPNTSTMPLPSPSRPSLVSSMSSSVRSTRSQCKYHRITLPKEEGGPRVSFLVPGCSLTNQELMKEEEIEDHGEATYEDSLRIVRDIEYLDFDQYLIGILRQLVGLDILREGEVFYLPQPGEEIVRKYMPRRSISDKLGLARAPFGGEYAASFSGSPSYSYSGSARSPSTRPPLSNADSASTSLSIFRKVADSEMGSTVATTDSDSELADDGHSVGRTDAQNTDGNAMSPAKNKKKNSQRNKRKDISYQPNEQDEESQDEKTQKRRRTLKRGVKRTRTAEVVTVDGPRKSKRLRQQLSVP